MYKRKIRIPAAQFGANWMNQQMAYTSIGNQAAVLPTQLSLAPVPSISQLQMLGTNTPTTGGINVDVGQLASAATEGIAYLTSLGGRSTATSGGEAVTQSLADIGRGIGTGMKIGAAFGPIGAGIGAAAGAVTGLIGRKGEEAEMTSFTDYDEGTLGTGLIGAFGNRKLRRRRRQIRMNAMQNRDAVRGTEFLASEYANEYGDLDDNTFADGGVAHSLAYVDDGELISTPDGGISKVPENGNPTDSNLVSLPVGSKILSDSLKVPGTKKTFAELGEEMMAKRKSKFDDIYAQNAARLNEMNNKTIHDLLFDIQEQVKANRGIKRKYKNAVIAAAPGDEVPPYIDPQWAYYPMTVQTAQSTPTTTYTPGDETLPSNYYTVNGVRRAYDPNSRTFLRYNDGRILFTPNALDEVSSGLPINIDGVSYTIGNPYSRRSSLWWLNPVQSRGQQVDNFSASFIDPNMNYISGQMLPEVTVTANRAQSTPAQSGDTATSAYPPYIDPRWAFTPTITRPTGTQTAAQTTLSTPVTPYRAQSTTTSTQPALTTTNTHRTSTRRSGINPWAYGDDFRYLRDGVYDEGYLNFMRNGITQEMVDRAFEERPELFSRFTAANPNYRPTVSQVSTWGTDFKPSDFHRFGEYLYDNRARLSGVPAFTPGTDVDEDAVSVLSSVPATSRATTSTTPTTGRINVTDDGNNGSGNSGTNWWRVAGDVLTGVAELAPAFANMFTGMPHPVSANYNPYANAIRNTMAGRRYDINPMIRDIQRNRAISNYNASLMNTNTGANLAFRLANANNTYNAIANARSVQNNMNNEYAADYANTLNSLGQQWVNASNAAEDINRRNYANARNMRREGYAQLSEWLQQRRLERNQRNRDNAMLTLYGPYLQAGYTAPTLDQYYNFIRRGGNNAG